MVKGSDRILGLGEGLCLGAGRKRVDRAETRGRVFRFLEAGLMGHRGITVENGVGSERP
jgi:hypothetical protein